MADINRSDAEGLLQDQNINEILQTAAEASVALRSFRTVRMGTKIAKMPVLTALPQAGFVTEAADTTGHKPTSQATWGKKQLVVEEIAVIVPIHEDVFDDSEFGVWEEVRPLVSEALGVVLDGAVLFGTNAPASWDDSLFEGAVDASQTVEEGAGGSPDLAEDINKAWMEVENVGHDVNVQYAERRIRGRLRGLRDQNDQPIFLTSLRDDGRANSVYGEDLFFSTNGAWERDDATMIVGDRNAAILGIRQDVTYKILTEATLTDGSGNVTISLAEQDMIALRAKFRVAFAVADPIVRETGAREWPFAALVPAGS